MYVLFRLANPGDLEKIREIGIKSLKSAYNNYPEESITKLANEFLSITNLQNALANAGNDKDIFIVAEALNRFAGYCHVTISGKTCSLRVIGVDDFFQSKGMGSRLLSKGGLFAKEKGCSKFVAYVNSRNARLRNFYTKNEFLHMENKDKIDNLKNTLWHMEKQIE